MRPDRKYDESKVKVAAKAETNVLPVILLVVISVLVLLIGAPSGI